MHDRLLETRGGERAGAALLLALVLLSPLAVWPAAWLWVQTRAGQEDVRERLTKDLRPEALRFDRFQWGPHPAEIWLLGARIQDRRGERALGAAVVGGRLELGEGGLRLAYARAADYEVRLSWDEQGVFNLKDALKKEREKRPEEPKPPAPRLRIDGLVLSRGRVVLDWPRWSLDFEDVDTRGWIHIGGPEGLEFEARLTAGRSRARDSAKDLVAFEDLEIRGFRWKDMGFHAGSVVLTRRDGSRVSASGTMSFADEVLLGARAEGKLEAAAAPAFLEAVFPGGVVLDGVTAHLDGEQLRLDATRARAPVVVAGPIRAEDVDLPIELRRRPGGVLIPDLEVHSTEARASSLAVHGGAVLREVRIARIDARGRDRIEAEVAGARAEALQLPDGEVGFVAARGRLEGGLTFARAVADVETAQGALHAEGRLEVKLLGDRRVPVDVTLSELDGALASTLLRAVPGEVQRRLVPPLSGRARFVGRVDEDRLRFALESGEIEGAGRVIFREGSWIVASSGLPRGGESTP